MKKRLGQHFLSDSDAAELIVSSAGLTPGEAVIEIGPGRGALTGLIAGRAGEVFAVEIDAGLCGMLRKKFAGAGNVSIINANFLDIGFSEIFRSRAPYSAVKVIGNIPYYITAPILAKLFGWKEHISRVVLTVQKEVAERMAASPGGKIYGALSVFVQFNSRVRKIADLGRECFSPPPEVDSAVVAMEILKEAPFDVGDAKLFQGFVKSMFASKRKMVHNALAGAAHCGREESFFFLDAAGINPARRPETLSVGEYAGLFNLVAGRKSCGG